MSCWNNPDILPIKVFLWSFGRFQLPTGRSRQTCICRPRDVNVIHEMLNALSLSHRRLHLYRLNRLMRTNPLEPQINRTICDIFDSSHQRMTKWMYGVGDLTISEVTAYIKHIGGRYGEEAPLRMLREITWEPDDQLDKKNI